MDTNSRAWWFQLSEGLRPLFILQIEQQISAYFITYFRKKNYWGIDETTGDRMDSKIPKEKSNYEASLRISCIPHIVK